MKRNLIIIVAILTMSFSVNAQKSIHEFKVKDINGKAFDFASLKGKKVMIVNVASKCGLTPQYELLQNLYEEYSSENFIIVGFPANNFMGQEPGTNEEIATFCSTEYGVTFPMMEKIEVKGKKTHPIYKWLTTKKLNKLMDSSISWNFQKYLIDENGNLVGMLSPREKPNDQKVIDWIKGGEFKQN